jgi:UDP-2,4-diacetamido-2,4,6-trideoxy-beta-L-altropyranose hydrolase
VSQRHAVIRADASVALGMGHLVRSRTLAEGLMGRGWRTTIVTRDLVDDLAAGLDAAGIDIVRLPSGSSIESEPEAIAGRVGPDVALVVSDHYGLGGAWHRAMRRRIPGAAFMAIDDLADRWLPVDLVLNQNLGATAGAYATLTPASTRILAGAAFALLRPEFGELRARGRLRDGRVDRIIVFFSGSDGPDVTGRAVDGLAGLGLPIDVVVGATYPHLATLQAAVARELAVTIFVNTDDMASLMARADLALGAASSASWERCSLGLPALLVTMADNQVDAERRLVEAGAALAIGWHTSVTATDIERAVRAVCADPERVKAMSAAAARITDGRGTERIIAEIEAIVGTHAEAG